MDEVFSAVPSSWVTSDGYCFWPKANVRFCIIKYKPPSKDWEKHAVKLCGKYGTYQQALKKERKLSNYNSDSNSTESETLGRGFRTKKTIPKISEEHYDLESDESEESVSSIPESLPIPGHDNVAINIPDVIENRNYLEDDIATEIVQPIGNNIETSADVILKHLVELKIIFSKLDARVQNIEKMVSAGKCSANVPKYTLLPNLPLNSLNEVTSFEEILINSADAKIQLTNLIEMIGGSNAKDGLKRGLFKLFTNQLASKCSWTGAKSNFPLKNLNIIQCLRAALKVNFTDLKEAEFEEMLKLWFRQASLRLSREKNNIPVDGEKNNIPVDGV